MVWFCSHFNTRFVQKLIQRVFCFKIILAIAVSWMICAIITVAGGFPSDPNNPQYKARTDARIAVLNEAKWCRFPYPGKECYYILSVRMSLIIIRVLTNSNGKSPQINGAIARKDKRMKKRWFFKNFSKTDIIIQHRLFLDRSRSTFEVYIHICCPWLI